MYSLRPASEADRQLLLAVYGSTRTQELERTSWTQAQKEDFIRMQFEAQDSHYRAHYPGAEFLVIEADGVPAGRLYRHWRPNELRIMDIALLPAFRGRGLGGAIMRDLISQAASKGIRTSIHVEMFNPARRLYERLGMKQVSEAGVYLLMETQPNTAS